ncbi:hypothetical protein ACWDUX_30385 [Streptomyces sp. NPDC003444]
MKSESDLLAGLDAVRELTEGRSEYEEVLGTVQTVLKWAGDKNSDTADLIRDLDLGHLSE